MQINNIFQEDSLKYSDEKPAMSSREDEIYALSEISQYLTVIKENLQFSDDLWMQEVAEGVLFYEWIFENHDDGLEDMRRIMQEIFFKPVKETDSKSQTDREVIPISLGSWDNACSDQTAYINRRREILSGLSNVEEYESFMYSCFINSCFASNILQDLKEAMRILSSMLLECSGDPKHRESLFFPFTYYESLNGINTAQEKKILCEPHLKLIRLRFLLLNINPIIAATIGRPQITNMAL